MAAHPWDADTDDEDVAMHPWDLVSNSDSEGESESDTDDELPEKTWVELLIDFLVGLLIRRELTAMQFCVIMYYCGKLRECMYVSDLCL